MSIDEHLSLSVDENGAIAFTDRRNGVDWGSRIPGWVALTDGGRSEKIPLASSEPTVTETDRSLTLVFSGLSGRAPVDNDFRMTVEITLGERSFDIGIIDVRSSLLLEKIEYPAHILTVESGVKGGYTVVPDMQGILIPSRYDAGFMRYGQNIWDSIADIDLVWHFESGMLNMPWFGVVLTPDYMVQRSGFADGTRVWVNYGITSYKGEEGRIPAKGFRLAIPDEPVRTGSFHRGFTYIEE